MVILIESNDTISECGNWSEIGINKLLEKYKTNISATSFLTKKLQELKIETSKELI